MEILNRKRSDILNEINKKNEEIFKLKNEILELKRENALFSDDEQWFTEEIEEWTVSKRPKVIIKKLTGRVNWKEGFTDEDTGDIFYINRSDIVRVDGKWDW